MQINVSSKGWSRLISTGTSYRAARIEVGWIDETRCRARLMDTERSAQTSARSRRRKNLVAESETSYIRRDLIPMVGPRDDQILRRLSSRLDRLPAVRRCRQGLQFEIHAQGESSPHLSRSQNDAEDLDRTASRP